MITQKQCREILKARLDLLHAQCDAGLVSDMSYTQVDAVLENQELFEALCDHLYAEAGDVTAEEFSGWLADTSRIKQSARNANDGNIVTVKTQPVTFGTSIPNNANGMNGEYYVNVDSGNVYRKQNNTWF